MSTLIEHGYDIAEMNRGVMEGKFYCYRFEGMEYLHKDGTWKYGAGEDAYFDSREEIESLLGLLPE